MRLDTEPSDELQTSETQHLQSNTNSVYDAAIDPARMGSVEDALHRDPSPC